MTARRYLADHGLLIGLFLLAQAGTAALLWLAGVRWLFIGLAAAMQAAALAAGLGRDFARRRAWYRALRATLDALDEKTLLAAVAAPPPFAEAELLAGLLAAGDKDMNDRLAAADRRARDHREYVELWVHEIKTPIAAAQLMVRRDPTPVTRAIGEELGRIDRLVEQALYYARAASVEKDFRAERTTLGAIADAALARCAGPLVRAGARLDRQGLDLPVSADPKWCGFVLEQLILNAVKYCPAGFTLRLQGRTGAAGALLTVADDGPGIPAADLPRVFDKGFTGENGRRYPHATGIGLYLCRELCSQMNLTLRAESPAGGGAAFTLYFPAEPHRPAPAGPPLTKV